MGHYLLKGNLILHFNNSNVGTIGQLTREMARGSICRFLLVSSSMAVIGLDVGMAAANCGNILLRALASAAQEQHTFLFAELLPSCWLD